MFQLKAKVIKNIAVRKDYYNISVSCASIAKSAKPGQFCQILAGDTNEPLLRRPLSIHRVSNGNIEFLYEVIGKGTQALSRKKSGDILDIIGPLGHGFDYQLPVTSYQLPVLVAGGMGAAPLVFLAQRLSGQKPLVLLGAKNKEQIVCADEFKRFDCQVKVATDDGSLGFKGKVTESLIRLLSAKRYPLNAIYACGPRPMLKAVQEISCRHNIPAQLSLEEHMACGIGACLGCVVATRSGYKRVCKEGPVFNADEVIF